MIRCIIDVPDRFLGKKHFNLYLSVIQSVQDFTGIDMPQTYIMSVFIVCLAESTRPNLGNVLTSFFQFRSCFSFVSQHVKPFVIFKSSHFLGQIIEIKPFASFNLFVYIAHIKIWGRKSSQIGSKWYSLPIVYP